MNMSPLDLRPGRWVEMTKIWGHGVAEKQGMNWFQWHHETEPICVEFIGALPIQSFTIWR